MGACTAAALVTVLAWACSAAMADEGPSPAVTRVANATLAQAGEAGVRHLGLGSTLGELLRHPAFAGHARRLLPRDDVAIDETLPIERMGSLLPYHSHVVPDVVLDALNYLIDEVGRARRSFTSSTRRLSSRESDEGKHRPLFLPWPARRALRADRAGRRVLVRRLGPRRLPIRA